MRRTVFAAVGLALAPLVCAIAAELSPLQGPYRAVAVTSGSYTCPPVPPPIRDIDANTFYTDPNHSIVDPERYARNQAATKPLRDYQRAIVRSSDDFLRTRDEGAARCTLAALALWAQADAMLGQMLTIQSGYERKWTLATLSLSYLKIRDVGALPADRKAEIAAWLARVAHATQAYYDRPRGGTDTRNNHLAWAALAVAATGIAADDRALFDWGVARARRFLAQVEPDGSLPLEVARKARAQSYHMFSLMPLVMLAELAAANGIDLDADGAIDRLAKLVVAGLADPAPFAALAGIEQEKTTLGAWQLAWAELYYARRRDAALLPYLTRLRPLRQDWLGGDLTLAFGVTPLPSP